MERISIRLNTFLKKEIAEGEGEIKLDLSDKIVCPES